MSERIIFNNHNNIIIDNDEIRNEEFINNDNVNNQEKPVNIGCKLHVFTATERNLVENIAELLSGKTPPSEFNIIDPNTNQESLELKKQLCQVALKVAIALMTSIPGKESTFGFQLGDFSIELRRDYLGKFFMSVEGLQEENNIIDENLIINENNDPKLTQYNVNKKLDLNEITCKFSALIMEDVIKHPELYNQEIDEDEYADKNAPKGSFDAIEQMILASYKCPKVCINRSLMVEALRVKLGIEPNELNNIGIKTLRDWACQSIETQKLTAENIRAEIARYNSTPHIIENVNSFEADRDMHTIEALLDRTPNIVNSKVDISNIGQVRTDPQEGMSPQQKKIHNFIADLFMPADTSLYDMNEGKAGHRIQQVMLQNAEAVKLLLEESYIKGSFSFETLPSSVRDTLSPVLMDFVNSCCANYFNLLVTDDDKKNFSAQISNGKVELDIELVKVAIARTAIEEVLDPIDESVNKATILVSKEQQQLVKDKFTASLLNNNEANKKRRFVPIPDRDPRKVISDIVKTPKPTQEQLQNEPERASALQKQRREELIKAYKETMKLYKDVILSLLQIEEKAELGVDREKYETISEIKNHYFSFFAFTCHINTPSNYMADEGRKFFDESIGSENSNNYIGKNLSDEDIEDFLARITEEKNGKLVIQEQAQSFVDDEVLKTVNIDLKSPTLSQMASEPDEFDKPGMGKLIKNVLMSYFSTSQIEAKMPEGITPELRNLAERLSEKKEANPKLPAHLNDIQKNLVAQAISSIREAKRFNEQLPALLKTRQVDKRSMISSMIRYSDDKTSEVTKLGAMLKGAGPLMHKLLQGLELPGMDQDFKTALDDMKSNLSPIDPKYVQAQMLKLVDNSNNTIRKISIKKPLGAASVGQAFLVTVTPSLGQPYDAVLKVIRPEVSVKTKREFEQFMIEARRIPGMEDSYKGLYEQYKREFSLELEANNIKLGQKVYSDGIDTDRVDTMCLVDGVPATETSMLIKLAPGDTLDRYISKVKARIDELKSSTPKTMDEYINNRIEMLNLLKQMSDINTSLGVTAKKWINKSIFGTEGFFHGDMHPGNLMVAPADPSDPQSKSKITIIDYGNASQLTKAQTEALLKINVSCSFGGIYQFEASPQEKPIVEKNTVNMFVEGFKSLLSKEDRKIFDKREKELTDNVIKPILLKGTKSEVGIRLSLLIKKLQQAGITIPGAISNMAESEKRLASGIDELNVLIDETDNLLKEYTMDNSNAVSDPCYSIIVPSKDDDNSVITKESVNELQSILNYDCKTNENIISDLNAIRESNLLQNKNSSKSVDYFFQNKIEVENKYKKYRRAECMQTEILIYVERGFKHSLDDMWEHRPLKKVFFQEEDEKVDDMVYGNYLLSPKEIDPLYDLHKQFLDARSNLSEEILRKIAKCEGNIVGNRNDEFNFNLHIESRKEIAELCKEPAVNKYMALRQRIANIIKQRIIDTALSLPDKMPKVNFEEVRENKQDFTTATLDLVSDKISGENMAQTMQNAIKFGRDLGYGAFELAIPFSDARNYFEIVGRSFNS